MMDNQSLSSQKHALEGTLTSLVREWLELQPDVAFYKASDRYTKGVSDFIICVNGKFVCAELKAEGGNSSAQQRLFIKQFSGAGAITGVCYTLDDVSKLIWKARLGVADV